jgi:hypothetical protein
MSITSKIIFSTLFLALLFVACDRQNVDEIIPASGTFEIDSVATNPFVKNIQSSGTDSIRLDCISIPFPLDFLQASGDTITVNTGAELDSASMLADSLVDFVYPFDAVVDGSAILIQDVNGIIAALQVCGLIVIDTVTDCSFSPPHVTLFFNGLNILTVNNYPYEINYPVTLVVDGNQVVINSDSAYLPAIGGSPFNYLPTDLVYPITITQFGRDIVLNNDTDVCQFYQTLLEPCVNKPAHIQFLFNEGGGTPINCAYFIDYPVEIISDGDTLQVQTRNDYLTELNSSPNAYGDIELIYPVGATKFVDGTQLSFGSDSDICQYLNTCQ